MKLVATALARKQSYLLMLLMLTPTPTRAGNAAPSDPDMGFVVASAEPGEISPQKLEKLSENLKQAAQDLRAGQFDRAINWYESALQLAPERKDIEQTLKVAREMREMQRKAMDRLPADPKQRLKFHENAYNDAMRSFNKGEFGQAQLAFHELWITAGDYNGKTVTMLRKSKAELQKQGVTPGRVEPVLPPQIAEVETDSAISGAEGGGAITAPGGTLESGATATVRIAEAGESEVIAARAAMASGQPEEARRILTQLLEREPLHTAAREELGRVDRHQEAMRAMTVEAPSEARMDAPVGVAENAGSDADLVQANRLLSEAERMIAENEIEPARGKIHEAQRLWPESGRAATLLKDLSGGGAGSAVMLAQAMPPATVSDAPWDMDTLRTVDSMLDRARAAREAGDLAGARELWQKVLTVDPGNKFAETFLEQTQPEYDQMLAERAEREQAIQRSAAAQELLDYPIQFQTERDVTLQEFMYLLSFVTPQELQYYIAEGARANIYANFLDVPLRNVLDTVLTPRGLTWTIDERNVITIAPKMYMRTYTLTKSEVNQLRTLSEDGRLQSLVWGQSTPPAEGVRIDIDARQNLLLVTGSRLHLETIESLLPSLADTDAAELTIGIYKINPADGPKIRAVINALIQASENKPFDIERKLLIDEDDMIIRETPENLRKIEELLFDKGFLKKLRDEEVELKNFSLVPRDVKEAKSDQIQVFTARVVEAIKVFLYAQGGESQAAQEGRRMWFDEASLQLTIVDTPTNLARVSEYIESLPELGQTESQKVIFLKYQVASTLGSSLEIFLNLAGGAAAAGGGSGEEATITLSRGDERTFRDARIRLVRVEENDEQDRQDDTAEVVINDGVQVQTTNLRELDTQFLGDYEVTAENVLPNSGQPGAGRAQIRIRFVPRELANQAQNLQTQIVEQQLTAALAEEAGISINPFGELNALVIRYTDVHMFREAMNLIELLDQPTKQVAIETKFVEVNESRAKEFSSDFNIGPLGSGQESIDFDSQRINSRFAQDIDEWRDPFSPPIESPASANLIKGTTLIGAVLGNPEVASISYSLRLLEAEGVLNVVTGPKVTALNGVEAEFRIESYVTQEDPEANNPLVDILNPFANGAEISLADLDNATEEDGLLNAVVLRVQPEITSEDSIILRNLQAEIIDFGSWLGSLVQPAIQDTTEETATIFTPVLPPIGIANVSGQMVLKRKRIATDARIDNGGTIILGGWTGERSLQSTSGVPVLRNLPYFGKLFFSRDQSTRDRTTLLIFLTANLV